MTDGASFTRNLPFNMPHEERMAIDSLGVASEMIVFECDRLQNLIINLPPNQEGIQRDFAGRLAIFLSAWSIVDRLDNVRQLINFNSEFFALPGRNDFEELLKSAQYMRNSMDHPHGTIKRFGKDRKNVPTFGFIGWMWFYEHDIETTDNEFVVTGRNATLISISARHHEFTFDLKQILSDEISVPFGNITLVAFDRYLHFDLARKFAEYVLDHLNGQVASQVLSDIRKEGELIPTFGEGGGFIREVFDSPRVFRRF